MQGIPTKTGDFPFYTRIVNFIVLTFSKLYIELKNNVGNILANVEKYFT